MYKTHFPTGKSAKDGNARFSHGVDLYIFARFPFKIHVFLRRRRIKNGRSEIDSFFAERPGRQSVQRRVTDFASYKNLNKKFWDKEHAACAVFAFA